MMSYQIHDDLNLVYVKTSGHVTYDDRVAIVRDLLNRVQTEGSRASLIDHQEARINTDLQEAYDFGKVVARLGTKESALEILVVASGDNRLSVDVSATVAASSGVQLRVCEDREEAYAKIFQNLM